MCNEFKIFKNLKCVKVTVMSKKLPLKKVLPRPDWDPTVDNELGTLTATASSRIKRDLLSIFTDPPPGLFVVGDESNLKIVHALIMGVMDTPYEGGFFYFILKCPNDYPIHPPKVKLMTTDGGRVRFNPNMYRCGKVCLSILGTWEGPSWSPAQQLSSLLLSIQSLMNEKPYFNEPGYFKEEIPGDSKRYNEYVQHETLRVSVCGMLENECRLVIPGQLREVMEKTFLEFYDQYVDVAKNNLHLDGRTMMDPFSKESYTCRYKSILQRLENLHERITAKNLPIKKIPHPETATTENVEAKPSTDSTDVDADMEETFLQQWPSDTESNHSNSN